MAKKERKKPGFLSQFANSDLGRGIRTASGNAYRNVEGSGPAIRADTSAYGGMFGMGGQSSPRHRRQAPKRKVKRAARRSGGNVYHIHLGA